MTLIMSAVSPQFILHVSDRLLTSSNSRIPSDPAANKCVIYSACNGVICLGYTGLAHIHGTLATDEWIAEQLIGHEIAVHRETKSGFLPFWFTYEKGDWLDVGHALRKLCTSIDRICATTFRSKWQRAWIDYPFEILASGYFLKRRERHRLGRTRAFIAKIRKPAHQTKCKMSADWLRGADMRRGGVSAAPMNQVISSEIDQFCNVREFKDLNDCEGRLVQAIRNVAEQSNGVGGTVMSVMISPPIHHTVRVRFHPQAPHLLGPRLWATVSQEYVNTPWIIGRRCAAAPATMYGSSPFNPSVTVGNYRVQFEVPESSPGWPMISMGPHFRSPAPR